MSRKALFFAVVVAVLVATFVAPVAAAPLNGEAVASERLEGWSGNGVRAPAPILPAGDCEGGAGGGCPAFD